jgi:hypothetical protein
MLYDPDRVGGLPATAGLSGVRPDAPAPVGDVADTDGGDDDRLALLAVNDIQGFWTTTFPEFFSSQYVPACVEAHLLRFDEPVEPRGMWWKHYL